MKTNTFMPIALAAIVVAFIALFGFSRIAHAAIITDAYAYDDVRNNNAATIANATNPYEVGTVNPTPDGLGYIDKLPVFEATVSTNNASKVSATSAQLNGYYDTGSQLVTLVASFEYGTSSNNLQYGTTPETISILSESGTHARTIGGLKTNTKYYYRIIARYDGKTVYGGLKTFTTGANNVSVADETVSSNSSTNTSNSNSSNTNANSGTNSNSSSNSGSNTSSSSSASVSASANASSTYARLSITDGESSIERGDEVTYVVTYEARQALSDAELTVELPSGMTILRASRGKVDKGDDRVVIDLGSLDAGEKRTIEIDARMNGSVRDGADIRSTATLRFETSNGTARSLSASDTTEFTGGSSALGASIFGTGVSLSFFNWLVIAGIIAVIIILARKQFQKA